jgi:hypothetical protein
VRRRGTALCFVVGLLIGTSACQHRIATWRDVARVSGCTPALLAHSSPYDSAHVRDLAGAFRLVQVDTTPGWVATEVKNGTPARGMPMRLWVADSMVAHYRRNFLSGRLVPVNRPVVGVAPEYGEKGFSDSTPQVEITGTRLNRLVISYHSTPVLDGVAPLELPIEYSGDWGFGGYFAEPPDWIIPFGVDGKPLPPRAGYFCAFRT